MKPPLELVKGFLAKPSFGSCVVIFQRVRLSVELVSIVVAYESMPNETRGDRAVPPGSESRL